MDSRNHSSLKIYGIARTPSVTLNNPPNVPFFDTNCHSTSFRFNYRDEIKNGIHSGYSQDCILTSPYDTNLDHFDINIVVSDISFGASVEGDESGIRVHIDSLNNSTLLIHATGRIAGLPDVNTYPPMINFHTRPLALMASNPTLTNFDYIMLRYLWSKSRENFYQDLTKNSQKNWCSNSPCHKNASCSLVSSVGFTCSCNTGFTGDGYYCE